MFAMRRVKLLTLYFCLCGFLSTWQQLHGQSTVAGSEKALLTTVCDLTKNGAQTKGKRVTIRASVISGGMHGILLVDPGNRCKHGLRMKAQANSRDHDDFRLFDHALYAEGGEMGSYREPGEKGITATFTGIMEYRSNETRLKWAIRVEHISNIDVRPKK